jgi:hypothetical protein
MKKPVSIMGSRHIINPLKKYRELSLVAKTVSFKKQSKDIKLSLPSPNDDKSFKKLSN